MLECGDGALVMAIFEPKQEGIFPIPNNRNDPHQPDHIGPNLHVLWILILSLGPVSRAGIDHESEHSLVAAPLQAFAGG